jgi:glycosyltransferase involved in cell wall biosynthesis
MYQSLLIKRMVEGIFIFPFVLLGRLIAAVNPSKKEYRTFFFFPFYHTGGAEKVHAQVAAATGGSDCIIFFTKKSADDRFLDAFRKTGCEIKDVSKYTDNKWLYFLNLVYRGIVTGYINSQKQKPVVFNGQCNFGYKISPWVKKNIPQIELIHSLNSFSYIRIPFLPFITKTVMISRKRIDDHKQLYEHFKIPAQLLNRIIFIPNAIPITLSASGKNEKEFVVLYAGRGTEEKRIHLVTEIAKKVVTEIPAVDFEIMGEVNIVLEKIHSPFSKFYGNVKDEEAIGQIYDHAAVLLLTSSSEGFPMVVMEAMAHGCVILSTAVGDIPYHIRENENGFLFSDSQNEQAIVNEACEKIKWLYKHPEELKRMSELSRNYAKHNFGIERFNSDYRNLFSSLKENN